MKTDEHCYRCAYYENSKCTYDDHKTTEDHKACSTFELSGEYEGPDLGDESWAEFCEHENFE